MINRIVDEMKVKIEAFSATIGGAVDTVGNFFTDLIEGFRRMFDDNSKEGFFSAFSRRRKGDVKGITDDVNRTKGMIETLEAMLAKDPEDESVKRMLALQYGMLDEFEQELIAAKPNQKKNTLDDINRDIAANAKIIEKLEADKSSMFLGIDPDIALNMFSDTPGPGKYPGLDSYYREQLVKGKKKKGPFGSDEFKATFKQGVASVGELPYAEQLLYYQEQNKILLKEKEAIGPLSLEELLLMGSSGETDKMMGSGTFMNKDIVNRLVKAGMHPSNFKHYAGESYLINDSNNDKSVNQKVENNILGSLTIGNPNSITQALAHSKMMNMRGM